MATPSCRASLGWATSECRVSPPPPGVHFGRDGGVRNPAICRTAQPPRMTLGAAVNDKGALLGADEDEHLLRHLVLRIRRRPRGFCFGVAPRACPYVTDRLSTIRPGRCQAPFGMLSRGAAPRR